MRRPALSLLAVLATACQLAPGDAPARGDANAVSPDAQVDDHLGRLPSGARLDPEGPAFAIDAFPLTMLPAPGGRRAVLLLSGWRVQGVQVVEPASRRVVQTIPQRAAFRGAGWAPDSPRLSGSGGNADVV